MRWAESELACCFVLKSVPLTKPVCLIKTFKTGLSMRQQLQFENFLWMDTSLKNIMPNNKKKHITTALDLNSKFKWLNDLAEDLLKTPSNFKTVIEF